MIDGVVVKKLVTHKDNRGFFREIIRSTDDFFNEGFAQWSHSQMYTGVIKAWHWHKVQTDYWYVCNGVLRIGLYDIRENSKTYKRTMDFLMGDNQDAQLVAIPPGVAHGCKAIQGPANLLYVTSKIYDPKDEMRIPYNDPSANFDWLKDYEIK